MDVIENIYIGSLRDSNKSPAMCCVTELEDVFLNDYNALLMSPGGKVKANSILFVAAISIYEVVSILKEVPLAQFSKILVYVFDAFPESYELSVPQWRKKISRTFRVISKVSHIFVPFKQSVNPFQEIFQVPVSYMPLAADVVSYGGYDAGKIIDINGYGRQPSQLTHLLSEKFNGRESGRVFMHTNHAGISGVNSFRQHRRLFWKLLRKSRVSLLFDALHTPLNREFPFSFVPQRMFESIAAGCVVVGKRPTCPEMGELFNWADSMIELPDEDFQMVEFLEGLLDKYDLESIGRRNYEKSLELHDWRLRINDMLEVVGKMG